MLFTLWSSISLIQCCASLMLAGSVLLQALDGFLMIVDQMGTVLYVTDDCSDFISLTPVSKCWLGNACTCVYVCNTDEIFYFAYFQTTY